MYTDQSHELQKAFAELCIGHDACAKGDQQNNSRVERSSRHVLEGARSLLAHAGLPVQFWPYAAEYFCLCNIRQHRDKESAWKR